MKLTGQDIARAEVAHSLLWRRFRAFLDKYETSSSPQRNRLRLMATRPI
jgi:hypothetical protein